MTAAPRVVPRVEQCTISATRGRGLPDPDTSANYVKGVDYHQQCAPEENLQGSQE